MDEYEFLENAEYYTSFSADWDETLDWIIMLPEYKENNYEGDDYVNVVG